MFAVSTYRQHLPSELPPAQIKKVPSLLMMWKRSASNALQTGVRKHTTLNEGKEKIKQRTTSSYKSPVENCCGRKISCNIAPCAFCIVLSHSSPCLSIVWNFTLHLIFRDVCMKCAIQMEDCPLCRKRIENRVFEIHSAPTSPKDTSWQRRMLS